MKLIKKIFFAAASFSVLILFWEWIVWIRLFDIKLFPPPERVASAIMELINDGMLFEHFRISFIRFFIGYISASVAGIILGLIFGWKGVLWKFINPVVQVLRPISPVAWLPFVVLFFGIGDIPAIAIIFIAAFFPVLLATVSSIDKIDRTYYKIAENFGLKTYDILKKIVLPAAFPYIAIGLHIGIGTAWIFLVAGEMVGAQSGLGFLIIDSRNNLRPDMLLASILLIGLSGFLLDQLLQTVEIKISKNWGMLSLKEEQ